MKTFVLPTVPFGRAITNHGSPFAPSTFFELGVYWNIITISSNVTKCLTTWPTHFNFQSNHITTHAWLRVSPLCEKKPFSFHCKIIVLGVIVFHHVTSVKNLFSIEILLNLKDLLYHNIKKSVISQHKTESWLTIECYQGSISEKHFYSKNNLLQHYENWKRVSANGSHNPGLIKRTGELIFNTKLKSGSGSVSFFNIKIAL
jgi:hypothetical protein